MSDATCGTRGYPLELVRPGKHQCRICEAEAEIERLRADIEALQKGYAEAIEDIESWAIYADEYFQRKHNLTGCLRGHRDILDAVEGGQTPT